jgi:hypothetical protein
MAKTSAHTKYFSKDGVRLPSVTTILYNLGWNKGALIGWARKTALAGEDPEAVKREAADIGTLAHAIIEEYIIDQAPHLDIAQEDRINKNQYTPEQVEKAENAFNAFMQWSDKHNPDYTDERTETEIKMISPWWNYGGTIDFLVVLDGVLSLVDFKTSNAVYADHKIQLAAYQNMVRENLGIEEIPTHLLRISKDDNSFHYHTYPDLSKEWEVFTHLLAIHRLEKHVDDYRR